MRNALLLIGWMVGSIGLYVGVAGIDFYWNLVTWQPQWNALAAGLLVWNGGMLLLFWYLARVPASRVARVIPVILCLCLIALGIYTAPAEPRSEGLFGRESPSPIWYRGGRLVLFCLPAVFFLTRCKQSAARDPGAAPPVPQAD